MNVNKLRAKIIEEGLTMEKTAILIGISPPTMYRKMKSPSGITIGEAMKLKKLLNMSDIEAIDIFLNR